jgi:hypothetical protein
MIMPQVGMIITLLHYRWSKEKEKLMVVYSISVLSASSSSSTSFRSSKVERLKDEDL